MILHRAHKSTRASQQSASRSSEADGTVTTMYGLLNDGLNRLAFTEKRWLRRVETARSEKYATARARVQDT
jgi:hypothetical protein